MMTPAELERLIRDLIAVGERMSDEIAFAENTGLFERLTAARRRELLRLVQKWTRLRNEAECEGLIPPP